MLLVAGATGLAVIFPDLVARLAPLFLYYPERLPQGRSAPEAWGLSDAEEHWLHTADGVRLHAWLVPARGAEPARGAALFLHGNAGHLAHRAPIAADLADLGLDVLLFDWRGYGRSGGRPDERGLHEDARAAWRYLVDETGAAPSRTVLIGNSLGGAVAAALAGEVPAAGVVVTGGFRSVPHVGARLYAWLPARAFAWTRNRFDAESALARSLIPKLVACAELDAVIPCAETRALYESAAEPKRWAEVPGAGHNDLWATPGLWREVEAFVEGVLGAAGGGAGPPSRSGDAGAGSP